MSDLQKLTIDRFEQEVLKSPIPVVLDFWGPRCIPCIQIEPFVEALSAEFAGRVTVMKVVAPESRKLCIQLKVMGLPTFLAFSQGQEVARFSGDITRESVRGLMEDLAGAKEILSDTAN